LGIGIMKKILLAAAAAIAVAMSGSAFAADLALKAAPYVPASWAGGYGGLTLGWGYLDGTVTETPGTFCNAGLPACPDAGTALASAIPGSYGIQPNGFLGGAELGYNWQAGRVVYGLETDFSGANIDGSATSSNVGSGPINVVGTASERLSYLGTVRARLGWTPVDPLLLYATGGFAYGGAKSSTQLTEFVTGPCACGPSPSVVTNSSSTLTGWTVGGGVEWMFAPHWSVKGEYLYYDLGSMGYAVPTLTQANSAGTPIFGASVAASASVKGGLTRVGVNFKF
jgi:outer membrane immunogenic protein